jgi:DNA-directed RNA polymerase specialized sigma24 family protein
MQTVRLIERSEALPIGERTVFKEFYLQGRTPEQICDTHGWTMNQFQATNVSVLRALRASANDDSEASDAVAQL